MKTIFETFGVTYRQAGDYTLPNADCPESANIGIWGQHWAQSIQDKKKVLYFNMLINGTLNDGLEGIDILSKDGIPMLLTIY